MKTETQLQKFKISFPGTEVVAICDGPEAQAEMRTLADHGLAPVRVLEKRLSDAAKWLLGDRHSNSQCGKLVRDAISNTHVPRPERRERDRKLKGPTFKSGALYVRRA